MAIPTKILRIKDGKFYYTKIDSIDIRETNIPNGINFSYGREIFWEVELFNFNKDTKEVSVRVLDYFPENILNFFKQKQKREVKSFRFEKFEWSKIEHQLSSYPRGQLSDIMVGLPNIENRNKELSEIEERFNKSNFNLKEIDDFIENQGVTINEKFSIYYKNAVFKDGLVSVNFKPKLCSKKEEIKILNSKILCEYDYIKNYFPKYFKKGKKFIVQLNGEVQLGKLIKYEASSKEIEIINENVISTVRNIIDVELFDTVETGNIGKSILSVENLIDVSNFDPNKTFFNVRDPQNLLNSIIKIKDVKNKKQLEYLAGLKQDENYQLRFTLKPLFGFLFYVEGHNGNHFCWELLNSHATYIWSFDSKYAFFEILNEIDNIINYIRINGRKKYKELVKIESENKFLFSTLYHKKKLTKNKDGFVEWKNDLEKIIKKQCQ
tara:strand:+ start:419 stop:1729 length:1311 start_codon:yes stop_codon:yes gene_type:complete